MLAQSARQTEGWVDDGREVIDIHLKWHPPCRQRRDLTNLESSMKAYLDGIADALGVDDRRFRTISDPRLDETRKPGCVVVSVGEGERSEV